MKNLLNESYVEQAEGGYCRVYTKTWTNIQNDKRLRALALMSVRQMESLEQLIRDMDYKKIESLLIELTPITGTNGHGAGQKQSSQPIEPVKPKAIRNKKGRS